LFTRREKFLAGRKFILSAKKNISYRQEIYFLAEKKKPLPYRAWKGHWGDIYPPPE